MIVLPMPTMIHCDEGQDLSLFHQDNMYIDKRTGLVSIGEQGYGKKRSHVYLEQLIWFLETAKTILSGPAYSEFTTLDGLFSMKSSDNYILMCDVKCDRQYSTGAFLETLKRIYRTEVSQ